MFLQMFQRKTSKLLDLKKAKCLFRAVIQLIYLFLPWFFKVEGVDRSASEPDVIEPNTSPFMTSSLTKGTSKIPPLDLESLRYRARSQSNTYKKSVSYNGNIHRLPEGINICRSPDENRLGSPDPKGRLY